MMGIIQNRLFQATVGIVLLLFWQILWQANSLAAERSNDLLTPSELQQRYTDSLITGKPVAALRDKLLVQNNTQGEKPQLGKPKYASTHQYELEQFKQTLNRLYVQASLDANDIKIILQGYEQLKATHLLFSARFQSIKTRLETISAAGQFESRRQQAENHYYDEINNLLELFEPLLKQYNESPEQIKLLNNRSFNKKIKKNIARGKQLINSREEQNITKILRNNFLPLRNLKTERRTPVTEPSITPSYASADESQAQVSAEDLQNTADAQLTQEILAQAQALDNDYIRIYQFVKNEIKTQWYAGAMKGAVGTLRQKSGNDIDQANLLIALFRASGLASRYVHGVVELSLSDIGDSLALTQATQITRALDLAGIAYSPIVRGGKLAAVNIEQTWVSAYLPYTNYRGAVVDRSGETWLPLMPALKNYTVKAASNIIEQAEIDVEALMGAYLQQTQTQDIQQQLTKLVNDFLQTQEESETFQQQLTSITIKPKKLGLIPNTLPVTVISVTGESASLSEQYQQRIRINLKNGVNQNSNTILTQSYRVSELASNRVTLSYLPASVEDHRISNAYGGLDLVPAYLIKLRPQIKINGRTSAVAAAAVNTGIPQSFDFELITPNGTQRINNTVISGSYHALAISAQAVAQKIISDDPSDTEYQAARLLNRIAYDYSDHWTQAENEFSALMNNALIRPLPSIAIVSNDMKVDTVFGQAQQISWQAVTLDAAMRVTQTINRDKQADKEIQLLKLSALHGSTLEHTRFEDLFLASSISADKGIQLAREQALPVITIKQNNIATQLAQLSHPQIVLDDIQNWVSLGYSVEIPQNQQTVDAWQGSAWRVEDPKSGAAGYFIAGGLAGGSTTQNAEDWVADWLQQALASANSQEPNQDPSEAISITKLPETNGQTGTAGLPLSKPLSVLVRDAQGAPVQGVEVYFRVVAGGGQFTQAGTAISVLTNELGLASASLTLGEKTSDNPIFINQTPGDQYVTQAGYNIVEVNALNAVGVITTEQPFVAVAQPGPASLLVNTATHQYSVVPGLPIATVSAQVQDEFGNSISNINISAEVAGSLAANCTDALFTNALLYNPVVPAEGQRECTAAIPLPGECGSSEKVILTTHSGVTFGVIAGLGFKEYAMSVSAAGLQDFSKTLYAAGSCDSIGCPGNPLGDQLKIIVQFSTITDANGNIIQAGKAGEIISDANTFTTLVGEHSIGYKRVELRPRAAERGAILGRLRQAGVWILSDTPGAEVTATKTIGLGQYSADLLTAATPNLNKMVARLNLVDILKLAVDEANDLRRSDLNCTYEYALSNLPPLQADRWQEFGPGGAYGILPELNEITSIGVAEDLESNVVHIGDGDLTAYPVEISFNIFPEDYVGGNAAVRLYKDNVLLNTIPVATASGAGSIQIPRGTRLDTDGEYQAELVINQGLKWEVKSDRIDLPVRHSLIKSYRKTLTVLQDVDIVNQRSCNRESNFDFEITDDAMITLEFSETTNASNTTRLIDAQRYSKGENTFPISIGDLLPGRYRFKLTATTIDQSYTESKQGSALVELTTSNNLPVGHTIVKGVDVSDGNLSVGSVDLSLPGRGVPLEFRRTYSSNSSSVPGPLGVGWNHNYRSRIILTPCGEIIVIGAAGGGIRFVDNGSGDLSSLKGYHGSLTRNENDRSFDFYSKDGTRYHYKNFGRKDWDLEFIQDTNGNLTKLAYDPSSPEVAKLITVEGSSGRYMNFHYAKKNFTQGAAEVLSRVSTLNNMLSVKFEYNNFGDLIKTARENDTRIESYDYVSDQSLPVHQRHKMLSYTDPNNHTTEYEYNETVQRYTDNNGSIIEAPYTAVTGVIEPASGRTAFAIDADSKQTQVTNGRSLANTYTVNDYGSVEQQQDPAGSTQINWTSNDVLVTSTVDANNVRTEYEHDAHGNLLKETVLGPNNARHTTEFSYYAPSDFSAAAAGSIKNRVKSKRDRNNNLSRYYYDAKGNLTQVTDAEGGVTVHSYADNGDKRSTKDANGNLTLYTYDEHGNIETVTDALGNKTTTKWNARSLPITITDALNRVTSNEYDDLGRLIKQTDANGGERIISYDQAGNKLSETDEAGRTTRYQYDDENRLTRIENPLYSEGSATHYQAFEYDNNGNKTSERDWNGNITTYTYDDDDRLIEKNAPEGTQTSYTHDAVGNTLTETMVDPNGPNQTTTYEYDELNRVTKIINALNGETTYRYDSEGNKLSETISGTGISPRTTTYQYDKLNRLLRMAEPENKTTQYEYDANGNRSAEIDANNNRREFSYDALNRLIRTTDALGNKTNKLYDKVGNLTSEIDARLNETRHQYDALNRRIKTTDAADYETHFKYDAVGNLAEQTQANSNVITNTYDDLNRLTQSEDSLTQTFGPLITREYDANGNVTRETDANQNATVNIYDGLNRITRQTLPENRVIQTEYDVFNNKTQAIDPNNQATKFAYDALNRVTTITDAHNNTTTFTYDAVGNKLSETDKRNNTTTFVYDNLNRITQITDALNQNTHTRYDPVGNTLTETDKRGTQTSYTYDAENRLQTTRKNNLLLVTNEYDAVGNKSLETDANNNKVAMLYDARNQLTTESRPLAAITRYTYDAMGNRLSQRDPEGRTVISTYDLRQRPLTQTNGENQTETYTYDGNGNRLSLQRPKQNTWQYRYDNANRLSEVEDAVQGCTNVPGAGCTGGTANNQVTRYTYDKNGNRLTQTDANNNTTTFTYDELNRQTTMTYQDTNVETYSYDANGNRTGQTDPNGLGFVFVYDALNRLITSTYPLPAVPTADDIQSITNSYDENNNLTQIIETYTGATDIRTTTQAFDRFDRLIEKTDPQGETIKYTFDANGNRTTVTDSDDLTTRYTYDELNRVNDVTNAQGATNYRYDRSSLKTRVSYPNGSEIRTTYDNARRTLNIQNRQNTATVSEYTYAYDDNGNRTEQTETNGGTAETTVYTYDNNDRLLTTVYPDVTTTYTYDSVYNRLTETTTLNSDSSETQNKSYAYNNRNQVTQVTDNLDNINTAAYAYDNNGNRISKTVNSNVENFNYDVRDQLREILSGGSSVGQFLYDYQGLRIRKQTETDTKRYIYDDQSVLQQTDDIGATLAKYDYGPDRLLSLNHSAQGTQFYLFDALGSVVNLSTPQGAIQARTQYDAWGNVRGEVGSSENPFGFTGHEMDKETNLIYMKARYYDPDGMFLSEDAFTGTTDTPPSLHKYLYAFGNPTVFIDLDGNETTPLTAEQRIQARLNKEFERTGESKFDPETRNDNKIKDVVAFSEQQQKEAKKRGLLVVEAESGPDINATLTDIRPSERVAARADRIGKGISGFGDVVCEATLTCGVVGAITGITGSSGRMLTKTERALAAIPAGLGGLAKFVSGKVKGAFDKVKGVFTKEKPGLVGKASKGVTRSAEWFDDVARNATRNPDSNRLVLGHFSKDSVTYQKVAAHYEASYFKIDDWNAVTKGLSKDEVWNINKAFLTQQVMQGKEILFSHNPLKPKPNSFFEQEVNFLRDLGYNFKQKNQWTWEAVR